MKVGDLVVRKSPDKVKGIILWIHDSQDCVEVLWTGCTKEVIGCQYIEVISEGR